MEKCKIDTIKQENFKKINYMRSQNFIHHLTFLPILFYFLNEKLTSVVSDNVKNELVLKIINYQLKCIKCNLLKQNMNNQNLAKLEEKK